MPRHQQVVRQWKLLRRLELSPQGINVTEDGIWWDSAAIEPRPH